MVSRTVVCFWLLCLSAVYVDGCMCGCMDWDLGGRKHKTHTEGELREGEGERTTRYCLQMRVLYGEQNEAVFVQKRGRKERRAERGECHRYRRQEKGGGKREEGGRKRVGVVVVLTYCCVFC